ncbi:LysR family transcriptional regulator [Pseudomonas azotoformans]|uniref:LysR family transcriptional regulator n=1 Tax=Pseudomonas azotoformans TaxID=47878 RepID=A0A1V2J5K6_PSEAZ|nr:LysR family transcriptional regulator [Pseudomonas azotoformans]OIN45324.1 LysR family transcriptional regulator [Pseudomonas azotoformans]ONH39941.1 LysR family transcriptional regulator [Pseudomonas azotoformans]SDM99392.1 DNA-binding transcriptional regulator, LysR family [Pseudomonas azotoformans]
MNLKALEYCVEIARQGSFTKAAQALHVAQPALSMAVSRLEDELGVALFNRATRQISVTAEGQLFLARAEACLQGLAGARRELQDLTQLHSGEIRVGVPPMYGIRHIPELLMQFRAQYPGIAMHVVEGSADDINERLATRDIDVALLESRRVDPGWESVLLGSDEMVLCMAEQHPLAGAASIPAQQLQGEPMLVFDNTFLQRHLLEAFCSNARVRFDIALESNFVPLVITATRSGMGVSTLLRSVQQQEPGLVGVSFEPAQFMHFNLCWRANEYLSQANRRFIETAKMYFQEDASSPLSR